jgi:2-polyprenyl-3-methyl-5-hydroxy-6-metoxy-1,4-benzoquinol methylase
MIKDIYKQVEKNIDNLVDNGVDFSIPVTHEEIEDYKANRNADNLRQGKWGMPPSEWIPDNIADLKVLMLAGAGGQQAPLFAALGADVTVIDLSDKMLGQDRMVAERENLKINIEKGNMCDLSRFGDKYFDLILNPPSLIYVPDVMPVFKECYRVLKTGGIFITFAANPVNYMCNYDSEKNIHTICNPLPFISHEHDKGCAEAGWIEYGHTLDSYIGGQIRSGFAIIGFIEGYDADAPCDSWFATRAVKHNFALYISASQLKSTQKCAIIKTNTRERR